MQRIEHVAARACIADVEGKLSVGNKCTALFVDLLRLLYIKREAVNFATAAPANC